MQQNWIIAYITLAVMVAHGYAVSLSVSVVPSSSRFKSTQSVQATLKYKNNGPSTVLIYKWALPSDEFEYPLFQVTRKGESAQYLGRMVKRQKPTAADAIPLGSGKEISVVVDLSRAYDMPKTDSYTVQFKTDASILVHTSSSDSATEKTSSTSADGSILQSESATVYVEGRPNALTKASAEVNTQGRIATASYVSCTTSRQSAIASAVTSAVSYASNAVSRLATLTSSASPRYTTWFGKYSSTNLQTVKSHFNNIYTVVNSQHITFDCSCTAANTYAYVYPSQPYKIWLCGAFWSAGITGTDSKAGTLIHEISHFTIAAGTQDYGYGQTNAKSLAISNPAKAIMNADNHEYFAENNPALA